MNRNNNNALGKRRRQRGGQGLTKKIRREIEERRDRMRNSQFKKHSHRHHPYSHFSRDNRGKQHVRNCNPHNNQSKRQPHKKEQYMRNSQYNRYKKHRQHWKKSEFTSRSNMSYTCRRNNEKYYNPKNGKYVRSSQSSQPSIHHTKPSFHMRSSQSYHHQSIFHHDTKPSIHSEQKFHNPSKCNSFHLKEKSNIKDNADHREECNTFRPTKSLDLLNISQIGTFDIEG